MAGNRRKHSQLSTLGSQLRACLLFIFLLMAIGTRAQVNYTQVFSPLPGIVDDTEKPSRDAVSLNGYWQFMPVYETDMAKFSLPEAFKWDNVPIKIPSPWNINSFSQGDGGDFVSYPSYPQEWNRATMAWMKKDFTLPENWNGRQLTLHFEAIAGFAKVYVNGTLAGEGLDIFLPTRYDVTSLLKPGRNEVIVGVAKASLTDVPGPYGRRNYVAGSFWGQHIAGIWQDVWLVATPSLFVSDVFVNPDVEADYLTLSVTVHNKSPRTQSFFTDASVKRWEKTAAHDALPDGKLGRREALKLVLFDEITLKPGDSTTVYLGRKTYGALELWTPQSPNLYGAVVRLHANNKQDIDVKYTRFGWRQFTVLGQELRLNGQPIVLKGDSWHFMGIPQMTRRYAWAWYKMLKDANANAVRLHAQPYPSFYLDMADEMGICVLPETGIWSSDGGPKMDSDNYWEYCRKHVASMVMRDRNHPSVFGWSVCNETLPVVINVLRAPESIEQRQIGEINEWITIVRELDPTRNWISGDGEDMRPTNLPVVIGHYGDEGSMRKWSSEGKPWGVGETGMAYYGTPKQVSSENGDRAYESQLGRMEGLAKEAYRLIGKQLEYKATYASVFNIVWYGLKPLAFGLKDTTGAPKPSDGIFFPPFREGVPGVQPERLGAYTSTLNPGYDPSLPLYEPWPLFDAIQAINAGLPSPYAAKATTSSSAPTSPSASSSRITEAGMIAGADSRLKEQMEETGVPFASKGRPALLIVDGKNPLVTRASRQAIEGCLKEGGTVWIWDISPAGVDKLNDILPYPLALTERASTSFVKKADDGIIASLGNKDYYFTELTRSPVMRYGLSGEISDRGTIILEPSNTDWGRWNSRPEYLKTAAVYRSEREAKAGGAALVKVAVGRGQIYLSTIDLFSLKSDGETLLRSMLSNLGLTLKEIPISSRRAIASNGDLERALYLDERSDTALLTASNAQFIASFEQNSPALAQADMQGYIPLSRLPGVRREDKSVALSFWLYSPRSLVNLLVEPDMPKLDMVIDGQGEALVFINGSPVAVNGRKVESMGLDRGWNHVVLRFVRENPSGNWRVKVHLESNSPAFFEQIKSSVGGGG